MEWGLDDLCALFAILLVLEGLMPAISPDIWRKILYRFISYNDYTIRATGIGCMIFGAILLAVVHNWDLITNSMPDSVTMLTLG